MASRSALIALFSIIVVGLISQCTYAEESQWQNDPDTATKTAAKEKKDLLLLFTGSDWCPPCQKLEQEVFSDEDFYAEAEGDFVFVKFDFLKNSPIREEVQKKNEEWANKFGVDSFPTIVLVDPQLRPYAFAGYEKGGSENFLGMLEAVSYTHLTLPTIYSV